MIRNSQRLIIEDAVRWTQTELELGLDLIDAEEACTSSESRFIFSNRCRSELTRACTLWASIQSTNIHLPHAPSAMEVRRQDKNPSPSGRGRERKGDYLENLGSGDETRTDQAAARIGQYLRRSKPAPAPRLDNTSDLNLGTRYEMPATHARTFEDESGPATRKMHRASKDESQFQSAGTN